MGLESTTFELEVQRADPLRHEGYCAEWGSSKRTCLLEKFYCILK